MKAKQTKHLKNHWTCILPFHHEHEHCCQFPDSLSREGFMVEQDICKHCLLLNSDVNVWQQFWNFCLQIFDYFVTDHDFEPKVKTLGESNIRHCSCRRRSGLLRLIIDNSSDQLVKCYDTAKYNEPL